MSLTSEEFQRLENACRSLPVSQVQVEESVIATDPLLAMMSTVLSLNRRWYNHALPARRHFEICFLRDAAPMSLAAFREFATDTSRGGSDWSTLARTMWGKNEWGKARQLTEWIDYLLGWKAENATGASELDALRRWSAAVPKEQFVGTIKGLGPRAYEQLQWYIEGKDAIKLDRHVTGFVGEAIGRTADEEEVLQALREIARRLGVTATTLDARIWDYMQARKRK